MDSALDPVVNDLSRPFWDAAGDGRLALPHCVATGRPFWPPSPVSPFEGGGAVDWHDVQPEGIFLSMVVYRRSFLSELADRTPYGIALVEVAPQVRLLLHASDPDADNVPAPGDHVRICFRPLVANGRPVPMIVPVGEGGA